MNPLAESLRTALPDWMADKAAGFSAAVLPNDPVGLRLQWGGVVRITLPLRRPWDQDPAAAAAELRSLADTLRRAPSDAVTAFPAVAAQLVRGGPPPQLPPGEAWLAAVRLEAACRLILDERAAGGDVTAARVRPWQHRTRFLLLSAVERYGTGAYPAWRRALGTETVFSAHAEQARLQWALDLVNFEDHPLLRLTPAQFDAEFQRLVFRGDGDRTALPPPARTDPEVDHSFRAWVVREAFLPRFMLSAGWATLRPRFGRWPWAALVPLLLVPLGPLLSLAAAIAGWSFPGRWLLWGTGACAAVAYLAVAALAVWHVETGVLWCLRMAAGAGIGIVALISLDTDWADPTGFAWLVAGVLLTAAAFGYLLLEAAAHGVPAGRQLLHRVGVIVALGFTHALAVTALVLVAVVPAIRPSLWTTLRGLSGASAGAALTLGAATALAAGVFLQVLWDDRPITYPLTALPWKGRAL